MTSMPEDIIKLEKKIGQLEIEKQALSIESKKKNQERISEINKDLAEIKEKYNIKKSERESDRKLLIQTKEINKQIKDLQHEAELLEKQADYNKVAEIKYSKIPELETKLKNIEEQIEKSKQE
jgi:ATP-dependent Clp protease ATP-binding subunit ClpB